MNPSEQQHPQEKQDRETVNGLLQGQATDYNLAELARLRVRYANFPGARDIQRDLDLLLKQWQLSEDTLYEKTRQIHAEGKAYQRKMDENQEDWS